MGAEEKAKGKIFLAGVVMGIFFMLIGYLILGKGQDSGEVLVISSEESEETESEIMVENLEEQAEETESEIIVEDFQKQVESIYEETDDQKEAREYRDGYMVSTNMKISSVFVRKLYLYQYIEYGLRKYNEEKQSDKDYFCDIEEDMLSYYDKFSMKQEGAEPFKTDLAKELLPELRNNLFNFCLHGEEDTLYMQIDTYNMKIYIYDNLIET